MGGKAEIKLRSTSRQRPASRAAGHHVVVEVTETAKLALPMVLTQLGQIAMMTIDLAFIGRIGPEALAAATLAARVYLVSLTLCMGLMAAIAPLAAEAFGANKLAVVRHLFQMGLWAGLVLSLPIMTFPLHGEQILVALGQAPEVARLAEQYLLGLVWGIAPAVGFLAIRSLMGAVGRPEPAMWITVASIPINGLLVYLLTFGKLGLPRLELLGVGLANTIVNCAMFLVGLWFATMWRPFSDYYVLAHFWRFDRRAMRQLIVVGTPISIGFLMEYGIFSAVALLMGTISITALAAHQIAAQVADILFMIPSGISMAVAVRVGHAAGRNDRSGIKRAGVVAILLGIVIAATLALMLIGARFQIPELFLNEATAEQGETIRLAADLLWVGAMFFITDTTRSIASGGLRGLKDTQVPLLCALVCYWLIGFPLGYVFGLMMGLGPIGIWIGISIGTTACASLLVLRFHVLATNFVRQSHA
ncbi:MATE family efflux transporter [Sinorhizobium medicae]|uniref:MATE family efflux transporter n=1 Tax=Sinorhizobium medicae TaxID=110321 RepID=UPI00040793B7|nr:MATE family efflux transporter [Sinorhizobium medicae]